MIRSLVNYLADVASALGALAAALLPRRYWGRLPGLPIWRLALPSAIATLAAGVAVGARGFLSYAGALSDSLADATLEVAARQAAASPGESEITTLAPQALMPLSVVSFVLFTPVGWLASYLVVSGLVRVAASLVEQPLGDPAFTGIDALACLLRGTAAESRRRRGREREEGAEVPDRLYTGEAAGVPGADYAVVSSRRKRDWTAGTFVITPDAWYTLGEPFDVRLPEGLRTVYPLTAQRTVEILRRGVPYELPPLRQAPRDWLLPSRGSKR